MLVATGRYATDIHLQYTSARCRQDITHVARQIPSQTPHSGWRSGACVSVERSGSLSRFVRIFPIAINY